jgi:hypothetical protein
MKTKSAIERHLTDLVGMPLWGMGRAASLVWLQFGDRLTAKSPLGHIREVGTYALHIDCPWSWRRGEETLADNDSELAQLEALVSNPIICNGLSASDNGSFELRFDNRTKLAVSIENDSDPDVVEYWRLLEPGLDAPHFVVGPKGVEP